MFSHHCHVWIGLLCAAGVLPAQTFVVDVNNGPGTHFTSVQAAITAVPDGADDRSSFYW